MSESKVREFKAKEGRQQLGETSERRSRIKDRFGRGLEVGDGILLGMTSAHDVVWRIVQMTPGVGPNMPPNAIWIDVVASTRVLFAPGMPTDFVTLVVPGDGQEQKTPPLPPEVPDTPPGAPPPLQPPGAAVSPGGIILSDPDGRQSDR